MADLRQAVMRTISRLQQEAELLDEEKARLEAEATGLHARISHVRDRLADIERQQLAAVGKLNVGRPLPRAPRVASMPEGGRSTLSASSTSCQPGAVPTTTHASSAPALEIRHKPEMTNCDIPLRQYELLDSKKYRNVIFLDGQCVAISCHECGANCYNDGGQPKFLGGIAGLLKHVNQLHYKGSTKLSKVELAMKCKKHVLSTEDVKLIDEEQPPTVQIAPNYGRGKGTPLASHKRRRTTGSLGMVTEDFAYDTASEENRASDAEALISVSQAYAARQSEVLSDLNPNTLGFGKRKATQKAPLYGWQTGDDEMGGASLVRRSFGGALVRENVVIQENMRDENYIPSSQ